MPSMIFTWKLDRSDYIKGAKEAEKVTKKQYKGIRAGAKQSKKDIDLLGGAVKKLGVLFAGVGAAALFAKSIKESTELDKKIREVTTLFAGVDVATAFDGSVQNIGELKQEIAALSGGLGSATELTGALYGAISAGQEPAKALKFIEDAARFAAAGVTTTEKSVDLLTTSLNAFSLNSKDAAEQAKATERVMDVWFKTVQLGKTTVDELASNMGKVIPTAAALKVPIEDLGASMATLTAGGISTEESVTAVNALLLQFAAQAPKFKKAGVDILGVIEEKGLGGAMKELERLTGGALGKVREFIPNSRGIKAALGLMRKEIDESGKAISVFEKNIGEANNAQGASAEGFRLMAESADFLQKEITEKLTSSLALLGDGITTGLRPAIEDITAKIQELIESGKLAEWATKIGEAIGGTIGFLVDHKDAIIAIGKVVAAVLVGSTIAGWITAITAATVAAGGFGAAVTAAFAGPAGVIALVAATAVALQKALDLWRELDELTMSNTQREADQAAQGLQRMGAVAKELGVSVVDLSGRFESYGDLVKAAKVNSDSYVLSIGDQKIKSSELNEALKSSIGTWKESSKQESAAQTAVDAHNEALEDQIGKLGSGDKPGTVTGNATAAAKAMAKFQKAVEGVTGIMSKGEFKQQSDVLLEAFDQAVELFKRTGEAGALERVSEKLREFAVNAKESGFAIKDKLVPALRAAQGVELAQAMEEWRDELDLVSASAREGTKVTSELAGETEDYGLDLDALGISAEGADASFKAYQGSVGGANDMMLEGTSIAQNFGAVIADTLAQLLSGSIGFADAFKQIGGGLLGALTSGLQSGLSGLLSSGEGGGILGKLSSGLTSKLGGLFGGSGIGKAIGSSLSGALSGGISTAISFAAPLVIGGLKRLFGGKPTWQKVGDEIRDRFGTEISEATAKGIADISKSLGVSRGIAELIGLPEIIAESEIGAESFGDFAAAAVEGLAVVAEGGKGAQEVAASLNDTFGALIGEAEELGITGTASFQQMILAARLSGQEIEEVTRFINDRLSLAVEGVTELFDNLGAVGEVRLEDLSTILVNISDAFIAQGGDIKELIPQIERLIEEHERLGTVGSEAFRKLVQERNFLVNNEEALNAISGITKIVEGLGESTFLTTKGFEALGREAVRSFNRLIEGGAGRERSLQAQAGLLQQLVNQSIARGESLQGEVAALAEEAHQLGLIEIAGSDAASGLKTQFDRLISAITGMPIEAARTFGVMQETGIAAASNVAAGFASATGLIEADFVELDEAIAETGSSVVETMQGAADETAAAWSDATGESAESLGALDEAAQATVAGLTGATSEAAELMTEAAKGAASTTALIGDLTSTKIDELISRLRDKLATLRGDSERFEIPGLQAGGGSGAGGLFMLHPAEFVLNKEATRRAGGVEALEDYQEGKGLLVPSASGRGFAELGAGGGGEERIVTESIVVEIGGERFDGRIRRILRRVNRAGASGVKASAIV